MNEIYVLEKKDLGLDGEGDWVGVGWTDDPRVAGLWQNGSSMYTRKRFERLKKMENTKGQE